MLLLRQRPVSYALILMMMALPDRALAAVTCDAAQLAQIMAAPTAHQDRVDVVCSATLPVGSVVRKQLRFSASARGVIFDCQGGRITLATDGAERDAVLITSQQLHGAWQPPQDITIRRCHITGSVRVMGMAANGEGAQLRASSRYEGHTARAQAAAPSRIVLDALNIVGQGRIPLYLAPGVTHVTLKQSHIGGISRSVAVYLDAESGFNQFEHNVITTRTERELVAIDG